MRSFSFLGFANSQWYDLTSYVDRDVTIPIWTRNKNGTPTAEGFTFGLVDVISSSILQNLTRVKFTVDNTSRFLGTVTKKQPIVTKRIWEYEINNAFFELTRYKVEYDELYSLLTAGLGPYQFYLESIFPLIINVTVPWLLECLLTKRNLAVDASALYLENAENEIPTIHPYTYWLKDIRLDMNMLFAVNQEQACYHNLLDDSNDPNNFSEKKITAFDLFVFLCGVFSITIKFENDTYILERRKNAQTDTEKFIIDQSNVYDYSEANTEKQYDWINYIVKAVSRSYYRSDLTPTEIAVWKDNNPKSSGKRAEWYNNIVFLLQDKTQATGLVIDMDVAYYLPDITTTLYTQDGSRDEKEYSFEATIQDSFYNVDEHYINPRRERSIIKQGVYT